VNLTIGEIAELPLAAALLDGADVLATTPEWRGAAAGSVSYRVRRARLVVTTGTADSRCAHVVDTLLDEIDATAATLHHRQALRIAMLGAALRIVAGRGLDSAGTSADVLEHAVAGIATRTALQVSIAHDEPFAVLAPAVAALVLVQLAVNAERHDHTASVSLHATRHRFAVEWHGSNGSTAARTARRRADRRRWGLGFARIAADSIGGAVFSPVGGEGGMRSASLETGLDRLALPLALLGGGTVLKATRAWDEETALPPGCLLPADGRAARCVAGAAAVPGSIVQVEGWCGRTGRHGTWVAIPPDGVVDRARDVLDGMVHERAMWHGVPDPGRSRIVALAAILAAMLGGELVRVPGETWNRRAPDVARAYGLDMPVPTFRGAGAIDPRVTLYLAGEFGELLETDGDELYLRIRPGCRDDPLVRVFLAAGDDSLKLS
jgi:hypothetical protein